MWKILLKSLKKQWRNNYDNNRMYFRLCMCSMFSMGSSNSFKVMTRKEEIEEQANGMQFMSWPLHTSYVKMAEWADETMIEKACEWLLNHNDYQRVLDNGGAVRFDMTQCVMDFRKAMEE